MPVSMASRMPASMGGTNSLGMAPPTILSIKRKRCSLSNRHLPPEPATCLASASSSSVDISCMSSWPELGNGYTSIRSEEHTSELQSLRHLVCRLLLEKKKAQSTHQM